MRSPVRDYRFQLYLIADATLSSHDTSSIRTCAECKPDDRQHLQAGYLRLYLHFPVDLRHCRLRQLRLQRWLLRSRNRADGGKPFGSVRALFKLIPTTPALDRPHTPQTKEAR